MIFVALIAISTVIGFACRKRVPPSIVRLLLRVGLGALILGLLFSGILAMGWRPLGAWTSGLTLVFLFGVAAVLLPFALVANRAEHPAP